MGRYFLSFFVVSDLRLLTQRSSIAVYADDSTLVSTGQTVQDVEGVLCVELAVVNERSRDNNMALNCDRTNSMVVCSPPVLRVLKSNSVPFDIKISGLSIEHVPSTKLLGLYIDSTLTWNNHIEYITKKLNKRLGFLKRSKKFLTVNATKTFTILSTHHGLWLHCLG